MASILVVDDDDLVRQLARRILELDGHTVFTAANGLQALLLCEERPAGIDLMISAVRLPDMLGRELGRLATSSQPGLPVLLSVGASEPSPPVADALFKPYAADELLERAHALLNASRRPIP